jgi:hypothetical protein
LAAPIIDLINVDGQYPEGGYNFTQDFSNLLSGTYLILWVVRYDRNGYDYYSLDGFQKGLMGDPYSFFEFFQGDYSFSGAASISTDFLNPEYMVISARQKNADIDSDENPFIELIVRSANLRSTEQHVWEGVFRPGKGMLCDDLTLSPDNNWIVWNCWMSGENYLYLLNIWNETATLIHSIDYPCLSDKYGSVRWWYFDWSPDSKFLFSSCGKNWFNRTLSCLLSLNDGKLQCSNSSPNYLPEAWSPDGLKVAIQKGDDLIVTDSSCLVDSLSCPEYFHDSLTSGVYLDSVLWSRDGNNIFWSSYPTDYTSKGYSTICSADLGTSAINCFGGPIGVSLISLPPEGQWFVISFEDAASGLPVQALLSTDGQILRRLEGLFEAWLVIP